MVARGSVPGTSYQKHAVPGTDPGATTADVPDTAILYKGVSILAVGILFAMF